LEIERTKKKVGDMLTVQTIHQGSTTDSTSKIL
jgi:hypothetical protein